MPGSNAAARSFELRYEPAPGAWLVGPTDDRPVDLWLPGARDALAEDFGVTGHAESRQFIEAVLRRFAVDDSVELTERLLRWRSIEEDPMPVFLGAVQRNEWSAGDIETFLAFEGEELVEPASIDQIDQAASTVRRSVGYGQGEDSQVVGLRYVADSQDSDLVAVMLTATSRPGQLIEALEDIDDLARTVQIVRATGSALA